MTIINIALASHTLQQDDSAITEETRTEF